MKWDPDLICLTLNATVDIVEAEDATFASHRFRFSDKRLRFECQVMAAFDSVQFSADPDEPVQGCPMFEFGFNCTEIEVADSAYGIGKAVRFYEHRDSRGGIRLTLSPRVDGNWYFWANAWEAPSRGGGGGLER